MTKTSTLRVTETFYSLQGESSSVGLPTFFIRLTGCPLRCTYCDTAYAFHGGELIAVETLLNQVKASGARYVCVTGGEPLAQPECLILLTILSDAGFVVSLETSGALPIEQVDKRVIKVMDIKTPDSNEVEKNRWQNIDFLLPTDQVKFVIGSRHDYEWSKKVMQDNQLPTKVSEVLFSPSEGCLQAVELAQWILDDKLPVRFQLQLHKIIWGNKRGV
jgi:7-carboxy-7-deazaguanine synthase